MKVFLRVSFLIGVFFLCGMIHETEMRIKKVGNIQLSNGSIIKCDGSLMKSLSGYGGGPRFLIFFLEISFYLEGLRRIKERKFELAG